MSYASDLGELVDVLVAARNDTHDMRSSLINSCSENKFVGELVGKTNKLESEIQSYIDTIESKCKEVTKAIQQEPPTDESAGDSEQ
jgi:hypothetical protein